MAGDPKGRAGPVRWYSDQCGASRRREPARRSASEPELVAEPAGAAAESADEVARIDAELLQQAGVLLRVDLVGQLALGLRRLVVLAARTQQLEDLVLGDPHEGPPSVGCPRPARRSRPGNRGEVTSGTCRRPDGDATERQRRLGGG